MTTNVIVEAHCDDETKVRVELRDGGKVEHTVFLTDGQFTEVPVYDSLSVHVQELPVERGQPREEPESPAGVGVPEN